MRTFQAFKREFEYYPELGERCVEIPLALEVCLSIQPDDMVEIGYVVARQINDRKLIPTRQSHAVIDLYDPHPKCQNEDAGKMNYTGLFVLSVSTLEHFDMPDHGNTDVGGHRGRDCLLKILKESTGYFITWPLGYNKKFDEDVMRLGIEVFMLAQCSGPSNEIPDVLPEWEQLKFPDWSRQYGSPFHYGNCVAIVTNVPWIMNHQLLK